MDTLRRTRQTLPRLGYGRPLAALALLLTLPAYGQVVTRFSYDAGDNLASVIDPNGFTTTYGYDGLGQKWQQFSPDTGSTAYSYDAYGRLASMTRAGASSVTYGYDGIGRPTWISAGGATQAFAYDSCANGIGRLCSATDATGSTTYTYSPEGWLTGRGFAIGGTGYALGYSYDALGEVTAIAYPDGNQALYTYMQGVVSTMQVKLNGVVSNAAVGVSYTPGDGQMTTWTSSNALVNTLTYDTDGRLARIDVPGVQSLGFSYDPANRIVGIANGIDGAMTQNFGYDAMSRLVSVYGGAQNEAYQYDANGNRTQRVINGLATNFTLGSTSNLLWTLSGATNTGYNYDARGNLTTINGVPSLTYDAFNRVAATGGTTYYVNPEGQRLQKATGGAATYFAPSRDGMLMAENPGGSGWSDYLWLNGRLIGRVVNGQLQAIHADQTGRPEVVTDANQAIVWRARNFAFDRTITVQNTAPLNLGFPGQYQDVETGLWSNGYRYYSAPLGRYIQSDPIGLAGGVNTYAYVGGNPLSRVDPLGLWSFSFEAYLGFGGAVTIGQDPTSGQWFYGGRLGVGFSAGGSVDPKGARPGADGKDCDHGTTLGVFNQANYTVAVVGGNITQADAGINLDNSGTGYFDPPAPSDHFFLNRFGFGVGWSTGIEVIGH